jgi:hypothetical protein
MMDNVKLMWEIPDAENHEDLLRLFEAASVSFNAIVSTIFSNTLADNWVFLIEDFK